MKIIHLSDTHVGRADNALRLARVLQDIASLGPPQAHVVVHTGDLNDRATPQAMQEGKALLDRLAAGGWRVLLSPGNHDYGDSLHVDPDCAQAFQQCYAPYVFADQPAQFPVLHLAADWALIGLDSNAAELGLLERWFAQGSLGAAQIERLGALLDTPVVRQRRTLVYLHHHPFLDAFTVHADVGDRSYLSYALGWNTRRFRRLKDAYSLIQCIRDRVDVLLFGHQHYGLDYSGESRRYGIPLALDASSTTCTQMDTDRMRYRVIDLDAGTYVTRQVALP
jgi:3',5'-cyclic AMP phosphodiesterase CpdA